MVLCRMQLVSVNISTMANLYDQYKQHTILNLVDDAIVSNANPLKIVLRSELFNSMRPRDIRQLVDRASQPSLI